MENTNSISIYLNVKFNHLHHFPLQSSGNNLEARLRQQKFESEVDSKWLQQEESNLVSVACASETVFTI